MIEFKNVYKIYDNGFRAVDGLSFKIPDGEIVVLIGPSGSGKTTSMRMINRLLSITEGEILIDGVSNYDLKVEELRRNIGYAIQQIGLFPHMTIAQNIAVVPNLLRWDQNRISKRVDELLDLVGLDPAITRDKYPRQLSGGQQQRVGVARALGADPPTMLMDEPFGAIDPITREILQDEFLRIQQEVNKTIVFVTHDIDEAIKMGDRICILRDGKMVQYDTPETLLEYPTNRFVRDFVGSDRQLKRLGLVNIKDIMRRDPPKVYIDESIDDAIREINRLGVKSAFVLDRDDNILKGWVNLEQAQEQTSLIDAMYEAPFSDIAVRESSTAQEALSAMVSRGFRETPVVDKMGQLVGSIGIVDLQDLAFYSDLENGMSKMGESNAQ